MLFTHAINDDYIQVIISTTEKWLWENDIPSSIFDHITNKRIGFNRGNIQTIPRHVFALREAFENIYGYDIIHCTFAKYVLVPRDFTSSYIVVRPECYRNIFYNEMVDINLNCWHQTEIAYLNVEMHGHEKAKRIEYIERIYELWKYRRSYIE